MLNWNWFKAVILVVLSTMCFSSYAQREVDIAVVDILGPDTIYEGDTPVIQFKVQNFGPSDIYVGDSVMFRVGFEDNQITTGIQRAEITEEILSYQDLTITVKYDGAFNWPGASFESNICALALVFNNGDDPIAPESGEKVLDNEFCKDISYINEDGWGVSIGYLADESVKVYPNPVLSRQTDLYISGLEADSKTTEITLLDHHGKRLYQSVIQEDKYAVVDVSGLPSGIYFCRVATETTSVVKKIQILN